MKLCLQNNLVFVSKNQESRVKNQESRTKSHGKVFGSCFDCN